MSDYVERFMEWQSSPLEFVYDMWGLTPQPVREDCFDMCQDAIDRGAWDEFKLEWFVPMTRQELYDGRHITWQQWMIFLAVERALHKLGPPRITVASGHGTGKDTTLAMLILWYLFCFKDAQVPCTAPSTEQMYDVLWKELAKWLKQMPDPVQALYEYQASYLRMRESPDTWFARAKTARKESPEALAGVHGDHVFMAVDEACHDDKTEVLTDSGWKLFKDLAQADMVMTLEKERGGVWQRPSAHHEYEHHGEMIASDLRSADFVVTPTHDLYGKTREAGYRKVKASRVSGTDLFVPRTIRWVGKEDFSDDWMRFVGWFLSEGSLKKYASGLPRSVVISQSKEKNAANYTEIVELIERLGFKPTFSRNDIVIHNVPLAQKMLQFGDGFKNKHIPDIYRQQCPRLLSVLLDAFTKGDGYRKGSRDILYTSSSILADNLQEVILKTGFNSTITKRKLTGKRNWIIDHWGTSSCDGYVVSRTYNDSHFKLNHKKVKTIHYVGKVYCVTVPNGIILTRRNGCVMWSGNSGVAEEIYNTAEGALTNDNIIVFLISNPTRIIGYFYDSHHEKCSKCAARMSHAGGVAHWKGGSKECEHEVVEAASWQRIQLNSEESPIVRPGFAEGIIAKHGKDSDEYKIRVRGIFADEDSADDQGYVPLLNREDLHEVADVGGWRPRWSRLGVDPSGQGSNETIWVLRDKFRAKVVAVEEKSTGLSIAKKTIALMELYSIPDWQVTVDAFGIGTDAVQELALSGFKVYAVNTGDQCPDKADGALYINMRAMIGWQVRLWVKKGNELIRNKRWAQMIVIKYRRQLSGKLKIMDKLEMRKRGIPSPDAYDALSLTFCRPENYEKREVSAADDGDSSAGDMYSH